MVDQPALAHLALVAGEDVATAEEVGDFGSDLSRIDEAAWVSNVASGAVERAFQAADRIVAACASFICQSISPAPAGRT
jgi:hypothetical protein